MDNPLVLFGFLSTFHLLGGGAIGVALRRWVRHGLRAGLSHSLFMLVWGGMFGCMPLAFGLQPLADGEVIPWLLPAEFVVLVGAIAISYFFIEQIREKLLRPSFFLMGFGGIFAAIGIGAKAALDSSGEGPLFGLMFGGVFFVIGTAVFYVGWWQLMKERR